eukprot:7469203-Pyramimonas_sp.AAC.1
MVVAVCSILLRGRRGAAGVSGRKGRRGLALEVVRRRLGLALELALRRAGQVVPAVRLGSLVGPARR